MHHNTDWFIVELRRLNQKGVSFVNAGIVQRNGEDFLHVEVIQYDKESGEQLANATLEAKKSEIEDGYAQHKIFQNFTKAAYLQIVGTPIE